MHNVQFIPPAALYLTAIIECVLPVFAYMLNTDTIHQTCLRVSKRSVLTPNLTERIFRHVLSNTGRVASRDSSRSTATLQDLFIALCEDDAIYGLFRIMKGESS